jgi:hypothetical protein
MINEDAPTNSVGTGAETSLPPATEPGVTRLSRKRPVKRRRYAMSPSDMLKTEGAQKDTSYLPFLISYDGAEQYVLYGKSESQIKIELRRIYRPENFKRIEVKRLYPNEVIKFYWKKRQQALGAG